MKNSIIVIKKQFKDTLKNRTILIQFILFPIITLVMERAVNIEGMPELFFTRLFSVMYIGMAPLTSMSSIISEEKEKNTLRVLMMSNVKPWEYLFGVGAYVFVICMIGAGVMSTGLQGKDVIFYLLTMGIGFIISIACGSCIGILSKNQMEANSIGIPIMMIFSFLPMLAMFNDTIKNVAEFFYTQQLINVLNEMSFRNLSAKTYLVLLINAALMFILFGVAFRKKGLE